MQAQLLPDIVYTDDLNREDLIITSDRKDYTNVTGSVEVIFSIENKTIAQNVHIIINQAQVKAIDQFYGYDQYPETIITQSEKTNEIIKGSSSPETYIQTVVSNELIDRPIWSTLPFKDFMDSRSAYVFLQTDETKLFRAILEIVGAAEFTIEAYGEYGGYGLLDPWTYTQNFDSLNTGDLNGQDSWSGNTAFDVQTGTVYAGAKAVGINCQNGLYIIRNISAVTTGVITFYVQKSSIGNGLGYVTLRDATGFRIGVVMHSDGYISAYHNDATPAYDHLLAYSANTWYKITIDFDALNKTYDVYIDDLIYANDFYMYSSRTDDISIIRLDTDGTNAYYYVDEIQPGSIPSAGGEEDCYCPFPLGAYVKNTSKMIPIIIFCIIIVLSTLIYATSRRFSLQ